MEKVRIIGEMEVYMRESFKMIKLLVKAFMYGMMELSMMDSVKFFFVLKLGEENLMHGKGEYTWTNGNVYKGLIIYVYFRIF